MRNYAALEDAGRILESQSWIFAKTMPDNPHHYTLRKTWPRDADFAAVVEYIRAEGYTAMFGGRPYRQLNVNEHFYWTMGDPVPSTILINRKVRVSRAPYDAISPSYDTLFQDPESRVIDAEVLARLGDLAACC